MHRLLTALILWIEWSLAATFVFATLVGSLEDEWDALLSVLALLAALSLLATWKLPSSTAYKLGVQTALVEGCVLFAFPFVWLLSTSMKYDEEIFVYPPRWMPSLPASVQTSPYATDESIVDFERPRTISAARWRDVMEQSHPLLHQTARPFLPANIDHAWLQGPLASALFAASARVMPPDLWSEEDEAITAALKQRIDAAMVRDALAIVYRGVALRAPTLRDRAQNSYALADAVEHWRVVQGNGSLGAVDPSDAREWSYAFSEGDAVAVQGDFTLPSESDGVLGFTLPLRPDRSWHAWRVLLEVDGVRYESRDALYWGKHRWQEVSFKLAELDHRDERELGIWPLYAAENQLDVFEEKGQMRVRIEVERGGRWATIWRKYTDNYYNAYIATEHRWAYVYNSVLLTVLSILGQVLSCSLAAYAFARLRWPGRDLIFGVLLATMMLPGQVTMIPVFMIFRTLGWYNTLEALWVPSFFGSAFFIFMLRQFMRAIPGDLEDAAKIDGCGFFGIYWRIILPLTRPALAAVCIFTFMNTWNDFMGPLIYINDQRLYPLALGLFDFRSEHGSEFGMLMAASTLMTLPVIAIFFAAQRYFIQGVTLTGMKG